MSPPFVLLQSLAVTASLLREWARTLREPPSEEWDALAAALRGVLTAQEGASVALSGWRSDDGRMDPLALTVADVAALAQVSEATVKRWIQSGELPSVVLGRSRRVRRETLDAFLAERETSRPFRDRVAVKSPAATPRLVAGGGGRSAGGDVA